MKVAVMANGEWDVEWGKTLLAEQQIDLLICADGGGNLAVASGRIPDVVVGDLDSITEENLKLCRAHHIEIIQYPKEKDQTDLDLALEYAENYLQKKGEASDEIHLYAAGGKRLDHLLGNIALMLKAAENKRTIKMEDRSFTAWAAFPGKHILRGSPGQEFSLVPLSEKAMITSRGLYYECHNLTLHQNSARGISNVLTDREAEVHIQEGKVLIVSLANQQ